MSKPAILSTRPLFPAARTILDEHFHVDYWKPSERISREELLKRVADKEGLVCLLTEKVDEELLSGRRSCASRPPFRLATTISTWRRAPSTKWWQRIRQACSMTLRPILPGRS